jgi:hypothetical protein
VDKPLDDDDDDNDDVGVDVSVILLVLFLVRLYLSQIWTQIDLFRLGLMLEQLMVDA